MPPAPASQNSKIAAYIAALPPDKKLRVVFGGHWSDNPDWLLLKETDQDITKPLDFADNSVDVIFTEHVFEHVGFCEAAAFLHQAYRILKPGGVFRLVCPMLDSVLSADLSDPLGHAYVKTSLIPYYQREEILLDKILGLGGIAAAPFDFYINSMFRQHGHLFIWSADLVIRVMQALGYVTAQKKAIGEGINPDYCIERRRRGLYMGSDWREEMASKDIFDLESTIVEATK